MPNPHEQEKNCVQRRRRWALQLYRHSSTAMQKACAFLLILACGTALNAAEVFEAGPGRESELPGGKEADGIRGDFVLRSDKVEAVVSQNAFNRRANMSTFYGEDGVTPGCLYDLTLRGANNDQLVIFSPSGHGQVSYVRIVEDSKPGEAAVETVTTAAKNKGIYKRTEYRVKDGFQGVFMTTTFRNETDKAEKIPTRPDMMRFDMKGDSSEGIYWVNAINPAHKCGYALASLRIAGTDKVIGEEFDLAAGQEITKERFLAVGRSPADAVGEALLAKGTKVETITGKLQGNDGSPVTTATVWVPFTGGKPVPAYPDEKGVYSFKAPAGSLELQVQDLGRETVTLKVDAGQSGSAADATLSPPAGIRFDITDADGKSMPCKAHFKPLDKDAPALDLGPKERAHGCVDQYFSEKGHFTVQLPPGKYQVFVLRGPEYDHIEREVDIPAGTLVDFAGKLTRVVDTTGWISMDPHNHSTPSGDNVCDTDGRLINLAAEHIEFAPTTEHNRLYDWKPKIEELGLAPFLNTVSGIELTGSRAHFNSFPFKPVPYTQDNGAPVWNDDPRITAFTLRRWQGEDATRWIQINHPDLTNLFADRDMDGIADGGFVGISGAIDGFESQNGSGTDILYGAPFKVNREKGALAAKVSPVREFLWLQLLNQGIRQVVVGVADAHAVYGNGVGCWHNYVPSSTDDPAKISWEELSPRIKRGNLILSSSPFLQVTTADGHIAGEEVRGNGGVDLKVRVQCNTWAGIDRVQVLVNGRQEPTLNFTREKNPDMFGQGVVQFDRTIHVPLQTDAHLIVVATSEHETLEKAFGTSSYAKMHPMAYNNPIFVDVDGNGFKPNGDTLGYDLPRRRHDRRQSQGRPEPRRDGVKVVTRKIRPCR
jgi:hypothetical protein